jgi:hypothetical protein
MKAIEIELPWPDMANLSPNSRPHWAPESRAKKRAMGDAKYITLSHIRLHKPSALMIVVS